LAVCQTLVPNAFKGAKDIPSRPFFFL
jgi:hypothetical protein